MERYCITHESYDILDDEIEILDCLFVFCGPPELPGNWIEFVTELSPAELERMNLNANELEADFS